MTARAVIGKMGAPLCPHVRRDRMPGVHWLQCARHTGEADVCADAAFESSPRQDVAHATDGEREDRILDVGRWTLQNRIRLEQRRLHLKRLETTVNRVHVDMPRPLD